MVTHNISSIRRTPRQHFWVDHHLATFANSGNSCVITSCSKCIHKSSFSQILLYPLIFTLQQFLLFWLLLVHLLLPFFCTAQQFWRPLTVCCTLCTWCACLTISLSLRRFSAQPPVNTLFASTPLLYLIIFCTQTCQCYHWRVICSILTAGSSKSVQNSLYNNTFFLTTYSTFSPPFTTLLVLSPLLHPITTLFRYDF